MKFSDVTSISVPEGAVTKITAPDGVLWQVGGGGDTPTVNSYSGSTAASGLTYLRCQPSELNGSSDGEENLGQGTHFDCDIINITATRSGTNTGANVISKIQNGVVTYYDFDLGDYAETTYTLEPYQHPGTSYIVGIELRVSAVGDNSEPILFDGTYAWSFSERAKQDT